MSWMHKLFGHKYRPRYDNLPPTTEALQQLTQRAQVNGRYVTVQEGCKPFELACTIKYVHDICERCGDIKKRT